MKGILAALGFLMLAPAFVKAGDKASFISLGLSPDEKYFAFAQYGEQDGSGFPYAELYLIDIAKNDFVPGGANKVLWDEKADPRGSGLAALLELYVNSDSLLSAYKIDIHNQPKSLVSPVEGIREEVEWFEKNGMPVMLSLQQKGDGDFGAYNSSAAFQLILTRPPKPAQVIGNFKRFRKHVIRYDIDRVFASKGGTACVVVVRMTKIGFEGPDIRYMVETVRQESN